MLKHWTATVSFGSASSLKQRFIALPCISAGISINCIKRTTFRFTAADALVWLAFSIIWGNQP